MLSEKGADEQIIKQMHTSYNRGWMFTADLKVVKGKKAILSRLREFAKTHPETGKSVFLRVPNKFGELVGYANAYCGIRLPVCPETEKTIVSVLQHPEIILRRMNKVEEWDRNTMRASAIQCLEPFDSQEYRIKIRRIVGDFVLLHQYDKVQFGSDDDVRRAGWLLLEKWKAATTTS